jgi:hypothetical protein
MGELPRYCAAKILPLMQIKGAAGSPVKLIIIIIIRLKAS